jgi:hypothetical protein
MDVIYGDELKNKGFFPLFAEESALNSDAKVR